MPSQSPAPAGPHTLLPANLQPGRSQALRTRRAGMRFRRGHIKGGTSWLTDAPPPFAARRRCVIFCWSASPKRRRCAPQASSWSCGSERCRARRPAKGRRVRRRRLTSRPRSGVATCGPAVAVSGPSVAICVAAAVAVCSCGCGSGGDFPEHCAQPLVMDVFRLSYACPYLSVFGLCNLYIA